jgi:hypothetical protein
MRINSASAEGEGNLDGTRTTQMNTDIKQYYLSAFICVVRRPIPEKTEAQPPEKTICINDHGPIVVNSQITKSPIANHQ